MDSQRILNVKDKQTVNVTPEEKKMVTKRVGRDIKNFFFNCYMDFIEKDDISTSLYYDSDRCLTTEGVYDIGKWFTNNLSQDKNKLDDLVGLASFFIHLKDADKFLVNCYYNNCCYADAPTSEKLVKVYSTFPAFAKAVSNSDIHDLIHEFDTLTDQQLSEHNLFYKMEHLTMLLSDQQLVRLMTMNREMNLDLHCGHMTQHDNRYNIIITDNVMRDYGIAYKYKDFNDECRRYIFDNNKMTDEYICEWLHSMSDDEITSFTRNRLFQIIEAGYAEHDETKDEYPTKVIEYLGEITGDDIAFMQKEKMWRIYKYFPTCTYELAKRFVDEVHGEHFLRLNEMLDTELKHNYASHYLIPINDDTLCYIKQAPFYRCQQYCMCDNGHPVSYKESRKIYNRQCGICRNGLGITKFINLSPDDFNRLFI